MAQDAAFKKRIQRIGEIVEHLESAADPSARAMAKELVESLMALHGAALERILEIAAEAGEPGESIIVKYGGDELVSSVLLLYGLHPENLRNRVMRALDKMRPFLDSHSARAELVSIEGDGTVTLRLEVKSSGCGSSGAQVKSALEAAVENAAPDASSIVVQEAGALLMQSGFVSVAHLESGASMAALHTPLAERSSD
jgi:Fe-S cluster biogenesis protein NfuA